MHALRRRAIAASVALFVAVWMLITLMLVTGHDPALARQRTATVRAATSSATTPSTTTPAASPSTSSGVTGSGVSAVTSSQS